jgi:hypothetical protein
MKMEGMSETVNLFNCLVRANTILFHYTRRTGRDGEIPVSWILRKLSDAVCKVAAGTVR